MVGFCLQPHCDCVLEMMIKEKVVGIEDVLFLYEEKYPSRRRRSCWGLCFQQLCAEPDEILEVEKPLKKICYPSSVLRTNLSKLLMNGYCTRNYFGWTFKEIIGEKTRKINSQWIGYRNSIGMCFNIFITIKISVRSQQICL